MTEQRCINNRVTCLGTILLMVPVEKRVLWHPRKENKFIVGGNSRIVLYEWAAQYPEIRHVTSQHDLHSMKCFAWSPDPLFDDLLAIGLNTGRVDLIRLEASKQSHRNVVSSGPTATLPVRSQRPCTALAFSGADPNYLAVGLDKVRGDSSLVIWDINTLLPSLTIPSLDVSNLALFQNQTRPVPHIPRVETHSRLDQRMVQQHALNEAVCSLSFLPSSNHLLLANISNRFLRIFDLRTPSIPAITVAAKIHGIATDPFDPHRVASFGDSTVTAWDVRKFLQPLILFSERDALADGARVKLGSAYSTVEFSSTKRGTIATLERDSPYVRFWDLLESRIGGLEGSVVGGGGSSDGETNKSSRESRRAARRSWAANIPWPTSADKDRLQHHGSSSKERDLSSSMELLSHQTLVLADTRRTKYFSRPLASFALVPDSGPNRTRQLTSNVMVVNKEGDLEVYAIHDTPKQLAWSSQGTLTLGAGLGLKVIEGYNEGENSEAEETFVAEEGIQQHRNVSSTARRSRDTMSLDRPKNTRAKENEIRRASRSPSALRRSVSATRGRGRALTVDHSGQSSLPIIHAAATPTPSSTAPRRPPTALFGRGDEDGFPALPAPGPTNLSAVKVKNHRQSLSGTIAYSQAGVRNEEGRQSERKQAFHGAADTIGAGNSFEEADAHSAERTASTSKVGLLPGQALSSKSPTTRDSRGRERTRKSKEAGVASLVKEDISMVMRQRVKAGYGLSQLPHNIAVTQDRDPAGVTEGVSTALSQTWAWLYHSQEILCVPTPHLHGYDFSYQGLLGIWEGLTPMPHSQRRQFADDIPPSMQRRSLLFDVPPPLPPVGPTQSPPTQLHSHLAVSTGSVGLTTPTTNITTTTTAAAAAAIGTGNNHVPTTTSTTITATKGRSRSPEEDLYCNWPAALAALAARRGTGAAVAGAADRSSWKPTVHTSKLIQRQIGLQVVGWSLREDELAAAIKRWQKEGQFARAACWLVFTRQYSKAVELLMRSNDETHQMMSGTIAALAPLMSATGSARGLELRELYGRLIIKLNDPYFRMLLTHLSTNEWSEVLDEEVIPFRERLAIAFQFLHDKALTAYLRRVTEQACDHGSIEGLIVAGLTPIGMRVIQSYLDHTGDVQTAAILSSYVCPHRFKDKRAEMWLETYRDLLDGFKLHHLRVGFDIERGQILHEAMQSGEYAIVVEDWAPRQILIKCHYCNKAVDGPGLDFLHDGGQQPHKGRPTQCSNCSRELPRCSVCLMTLSIVGDAAREAGLNYTHNSKDTFDDAILICQTCRHGGHAAHVLEWFLGEDGRRTHQICPVADCDCRCTDEF